MSNEAKDEEMICGLTIDERDVLLRELDELPDTMPPRIVWSRIREQAEAEGLIRTSVAHKPSNWFGGFAIAADATSVSRLSATRRICGSC